jgi:polysaccharide deacetylase family protein (PEP-CTERM system associated)
MINALSIDLEDWHHPELLRGHVRGDPQPQIGDSTDRILHLLDRFGVKATFFILGEVAAKDPELVRLIHRSGHEIASHGMSHRRLGDLSPADLHGELRTFGHLVRDILGEDIPIRGFRAPTFSLDNSTRFALPCLAENRYLYDSSVFPAPNFLYGVKDAPCSIYRPDFNDLRKTDESSPIVEFPLTVYALGRVRIPVSGGFYLRALPYPLIRRLLREINRTRPFVLYFHPWETYPGTPRVKTIGAKAAFITYYGIDRALQKVERILKDFSFEPMWNVVRRHAG